VYFAHYCQIPANPLNLLGKRASNGQINKKPIMKTMKTPGALKFLSLTAMVLFLFVTSCKDEEVISFSSDDNSNLQSDASMDAQLEDLSDLAGVAMVSDGGTATGSRTASASREITGIVDSRFGCAMVTLEFATANNPPANDPPTVIHGFITIDFGTGCTGPNGRVRKGKIKIEFLGARFQPGSTVTITTEDYYVDGIRIDGVRTEVNSSESTEDAPKFTIDESVEIMFLDGSTATRESHRVRTWNRAANPLEDTWTVTDGGIPTVGTTRKGIDYVMNITKALVFKRSCAISSKMVVPVEGTKELVIGTKKITTDFGTGNCDTVITITINGRSKDIQVSANGD
jgi:hypothetical protein